MWRSAPALAAAAAALAAAPARASAFQIETSSTSGCHEAITLDALARAGWPEGRDPPPLDDTGQRIADDVPFDLPGGGEDPWTIALLIGVRHNDVRALDPFDLPGLSVLHGDPDRQPEHCLRRPEQDGERGDAQAIETCREFLLAEVQQALALAGDEEGDGPIEVDMDATVPVTTHLVFRGEVELDLPAYPFHLGRALHALQDSYSHMFRNPASAEVRNVLNWVEGNLEAGTDEARDGHPHVAQLDRCGSGDGQVRRRAWAVDASADLLARVAAPGSARERLDRAAAVFDERTALEPGCTAENGWCGAREAELSTTSCSAGGGADALGACAVLLALAGACRRRLRRRLRVLVLAMSAAALAAIASPRAAIADPDPDPDDAARERAEEAEEEDPTDRTAERSLQREERVIERLPDLVSEVWGAAVSAGAAFDRAAGAVSAGVRWNPWRDLGFGLDAEYNPWVSVSGFEVAAGAASLYVPVIWRLKRFGTWELRTTAYAGASMILFDLVGVDKGTIGAFAGWNPLGLALPVGAHAKLVVKPGDIAVSAPQLRGIPFYYLQYRFTVGLEWYP
jgi:hypothetical protein